MAGRAPFDPFGDMLAGYRQADADNKQDLSFNAALEGAWIGNDAKRLQDLYNRDTYGPAVQMAQNQARQSAQRAAVGDARHPGDIATGKGYSLGAGLDWQTMYNNRDAWGDTKNNAFTAGLGVSDANAKTAVELAGLTNGNKIFDAKQYQPRSTDTWNQGQELWGITRDGYIRSLAEAQSGGGGQPATGQLGTTPRVDFGPYLPPGWQPPVAQSGGTPAITTTGSVVGGAPQSASTVRNSLGSSDTGLYAGGAGDYGQKYFPQSGWTPAVTATSGGAVAPTVPFWPPYTPRALPQGVPTGLQDEYSAYLRALSNNR